MFPVKNIIYFYLFSLTVRSTAFPPRNLMTLILTRDLNLNYHQRIEGKSKFWWIFISNQQLGSVRMSVKKSSIR